MKRLLLLGFVFLLSACGTPGISTPAPTPEAINLIFPADLKHWADKLGECAAENPQVALYFIPAVTDDFSLRPNNIVLELGNPSQDYESAYQAQLGWEQIVVIANQENDLSEQTLEQLQSIYTGQATTWANGSGQSVQVWVLPNGNPTRRIFDQVILQGRSVTSEAMLAPDPSAMLEAISKEASAIGYLPESILKSGDPALTTRVKIIHVDGLAEEELHSPVVALTLAEPQGLMRVLLVCLQAETP